MARPRKPTPRYLIHKQSGRGRAVWTDAHGVYHDILLPGLHGSKESTGAYARLLVELESGPAEAVVPKRGGPAPPSLAPVLLAYLEHAGRHYRGADGKPTSEYRECKLVVKTLKELYADLPPMEFSPLKLKATQRAWVVAGLSRKEVNRRAGLVRRIFKWAVENELIPSSYRWEALRAVSGLQKGRTTARETEPVGPVDDATVASTLPFLNPEVRGLVEFQRLTGCRPGEAVLLRRADIDTGGKVWLFRPAHHKNAHRDKSRVVAIGPKTQAAIKEFLTADRDAYLFSPARATAEHHARRRKDRQTPHYPSHMDRNRAKRKRRPRRPPAECYTSHSYAVAVARACDRAFPPPAPLCQQDGETRRDWWARLTAGQRSEVKAWRTAHRWHPNQLRHTFATRVRKEHGLEAAQVLLGHSRADVTQVYAERDEALAVAVAAKIG